MMLYYFQIPTPIGALEATISEAGVKSLSFTNGQSVYPTTLPDTIPLSILILSESCKTELSEYFAGTRTHFTLPLAPDGTAFQHKVWQQLTAIEYGITVTYLDIALALGDRNATRAVGLANGRNPLAVVVPCHRVIGSNGKLTGYAGGLPRKEWLLAHEDAHRTERDAGKLF